MLEDSQNSPDPTTRSTRARRSKAERTCQFCAQSFSKAEHLARHVRSHTREKPFECDVCHKSYTRHDTLLRHSRSHTQSQRSSSTASGARPSNVQLRSRPDDTTSQATPQDILNESALMNTAGVATPPSRLSLEHLLAASRVEEQRKINSGALNRNQQAMLLTPNSNSTANIFMQQGEDVATIPGTMADRNSQQLSLNLAAQGDGLGDFAQVLDDTDMWDFGGLGWPSWSPGTDFDLQAVNASIAAAINPLEQPLQSLDRGYGNGVEFVDELVSEASKYSQGAEALNRSWFSHFGQTERAYAAPGTITPMNDQDHGEQAHIDETYRSSLSRKLQPRPYNNSLPSTEFLNLCVQLYFARFHPIFPVVHAPTFRPSMAKSLLLLSICSIGSLFIGSPSATAQGVMIFEALNKCILNSWERYLSPSSKEHLSMIQAALIGQTFGLLSGNPNHINLVEVFNGTVIAFARQSAMFKERHKTPPIGLVHGDSDSLLQAWKSWVRSEEMIRVVLGLHVHDAELAVMFHHEPLLRHDRHRSPVASPERLFNAPTATQWAALMLQDQQQQQQVEGHLSSLLGTSSADSLPRNNIFSSLNAYALLEGIAAAICDCRHQQLLFGAKRMEFCSELITWSKKFRTSLKDRSADPFCLMILWHSTFMAIFADFEMVERAIGRDGTAAAKEMEPQIMDWVCSDSAKRCIIHASLLRKQLETMRIGCEPAIHVPQCLFRAALVCYSYAHFGRGESVRATPRESIEFPEIQHLGVATAQQLFEANDRRSTRPTVAESGTLCALRDLLQRVGHWGMSRKFASLLGILCDGGTYFSGDAG